MSAFKSQQALRAAYQCEQLEQRLLMANGLRATYYESPEFADYKLSRTDATVNFTWGTGAPAAGLNPDTFTVRWMGKVQTTSAAGNYTFKTVADDGLRLWVNNQLIINRWSDGSQTNLGTINLAANTKYDIKLEYYENTGSANIQLRWDPPGTDPEGVIPTGRLFDETRKNDIITEYINTPNPALNNPFPRHYYQARAGLALVNYFSSTSDATDYGYADDLIEELHDGKFIDNDPNFPNGEPMLVPNDATVLPADGTSAIDATEWNIHYLTRIALGNDQNGVPMINHMSADTKAKLYTIFWQYINHRSEVAKAQNTWHIVLGTDNHTVHHTAGSFLAARALKDAGGLYAPGGSRNVLNDGNTLQQHYDAWNLYWRDFFKQRAQEGIHAEHFSPTYGETSLYCYYNILDLSGDLTTSRQARDFLDLFWADVAQVYSIGAQIHTVAGTRMIQNTSYIQGNRDSLRRWFYMYHWNNNAMVGDPWNKWSFILNGATSNYEPPAIVRAMATNENNHKVSANPNGSYQYTLRGFGRENGSYVPNDFAFPSSILRSFYWTPDYVMGAETFDGPNFEYRHTQDNRFAGVVFNSGTNDRLFIQGIADADGSDMRGITAFNSRNVIVAARDVDNAAGDYPPGSGPMNNGVRIYFPHGPLQSNIVIDGDWVFSSAGNGYIAVRAAVGVGVKYTWTDINGNAIVHGTNPVNGQFMTLNDPWSPVVIQTGRFGTGNPGPNGTSINYTSFADFRNKVRLNTFTYSGSGGNPTYEMTYIAESGDTFRMRKQNVGGALLPTFNGVAPNLNPANTTYSGPYLSTHNSTRTLVRLSYPGYSNTILDFNT